VAHKVGIGWTRIERVRSSTNIGAYVGKGFGISTYVGKGFTATDTNPLDALALNGGRLGHFSRGFFKSADGATLPVRAAEKQACASEDGAGSWVLVRS
jgi:hypothetical protein